MINERSHSFQALRSHSKLHLLCTVLSVTVLTACGSGGSGAGDDPTTNDNTAALAVEPLAGVWNLPDNWKGEDNDEAYLLIKTPGDNGVAEAIVYDFDDASTGLGRNCFYIDGVEGTVSQSLGNALFMDISAFPDAVVSLDASENLVIVYSTGASTATNRETSTLIAERLGLSETDITPLCED